jgi:hypothetical protein
MKCKYCHLDNQEFRHNRLKCKSCEKLDGRKYYYDNTEKRKQWALDNKNRMKFLQSRWYQSNKSSIRTKQHYRYNHDTEYRLRKNLSRLLSLNITKKYSTLKYLDSTIPFIRKWFEENFTDTEMNWDNYGSYWEIDHVLPISLFDLANDNHVLVCFNWRNLIPYPKHLNLKKSNNIVLSCIFLQEYKIRCFDDSNDTQNYISHYTLLFNQIYATHSNCGKLLKA